MMRFIPDLNSKYAVISPSSTDKKVEFVSPDVMIGVRTPAPPLYVCEFTMALPFLLSTKKIANMHSIFLFYFLTKLQASKNILH